MDLSKMSKEELIEKLEQAEEILYDTRCLLVVLDGTDTSIYKDIKKFLLME